MRRSARLVILFVIVFVVCASTTFARQNGGAEGANAPIPAVSTAPAASAPPPREWIGMGLRWPSWSRMTGDWGRARTFLEERGIAFEIVSASDGSGLGARPAGVQGFGRHLTTAGATFDLEKIVGLTGSRALVQYQLLGGNTSAVAPDVAQPFSNIDAPAFRRFAEVWIEQQIGSKLRVKTGLIDANTEFAFAENTGDFINASMGFSPTVFPLPTFPDPHLGVTVHVDPTEQLYGTLGMFNGGPAMGVRDFHAMFAVTEGGLRWKGRGGGRVGAGYWRIGGRRADAEGALERVGTSGQYVVLDQTLWTSEQDGVSRTVGAFVQAGLADPRLSPFSSHVGGGLTARGLIGGRPNDSVGVGLTLVGLAPGAPEDPAGREVVLEAFHRFVMTQWMALKPDMQIIRHSVGWPGRRTIVAGTVRIEVVF